MSNKISTVKYFFHVLSKSGMRGKFSMLLGVLALLYLICPIDIIPDALIGPGQIDDIFFILGALGFAVQTYKKNLSRKSNQIPSAHKGILKAARRVDANDADAR